MTKGFRQSGQAIDQSPREERGRQPVTKDATATKPTKSEHHGTERMVGESTVCG
jgi:hypothetical protein